MADACANCGASLKIGMISSNQVLPKGHLNIINLASGEALPSACNKCGDALVAEAKRDLTRESDQLQTDLKAILPRVPVVSLQSPMGWRTSR